MGATVEWNEETQTVTSVKGDTLIRLTIGDDILYVNNLEVKLDVPAQIINNRTLVPVRVVSEAFKCFVDWDSSTRTVIINEN